jgi:hypothetical protein
MFEQWSRTIGGMFDVVGVHGFLTNLTDFYDQSDSEGASWQLSRSLVGSLWRP